MPGTPGGLGAASDTRAEGQALGGHPDNMVSVRHSSSFLAGWPHLCLAQGLRAHLGAGGDVPGAGEHRGSERGTSGGGRYWESEVGGAGMGWLTHGGHQLSHLGRSLASGSLRGQGEAESLRLLWPESSLPAQLESPHFSDKQTEASDRGRLRPAVTSTPLPERAGSRSLDQGDIAHPGGAPESSSLSGHCSQPRFQTAKLRLGVASGTGRGVLPSTLPGHRAPCGALVSWCHSSGRGAWGPSKWKLDHQRSHVGV